MGGVVGGVAGGVARRPHHLHGKASRGGRSNVTMPFQPRGVLAVSRPSRGSRFASGSSSDSCSWFRFSVRLSFGSKITEETTSSSSVVKSCLHEPV